MLSSLRLTFALVALLASSALLPLGALANDAFTPMGQAQPSYAQPYTNPPTGGYDTGYSPPLQGRVVTVPMGTVISTTLSTNLSSEYARPGDRVTVQVSQPVVFNGQLALPAGSTVEGQVANVVPSGLAGRNGSLDIRFNMARLPNGQSFPLQGRVQTNDGTGVLTAGTTASRLGQAALKTGGGAAAGALLGTAMGPLSGGQVGRGAIYGTAVGAGLGLGAAALSKGKQVEVTSGSPINIVLDQPLMLGGSAGMPTAPMQQAQPSGSSYGQGGSFYGY